MQFRGLIEQLCRFQDGRCVSDEECRSLANEVFSSVGYDGPDRMVFDGFMLMFKNRIKRIEDRRKDEA